MRRAKTSKIQEEKGVQAIHDITSSRREMCLGAPTGAGKTMMASAFLYDVQERGQRALFLVDREILAQQAQDTFRGKFRLNCGIITSGKKTVPRNNIVTAMVVTTINGAMQKGYAGKAFRRDLGSFDYILVDEAHIKIFNNLIEMGLFKGKIIGLTATPMFTGKEAMSDVYGHLHEMTTTKELVNEGFLTPLIYRYDGDSMSDLKTRNKDYGEKQVFEALQKRGKVTNLVPLVNQTLDKYGRFFPNGLKGLLYANGSDYIIKLCEMMRQGGFNIDYVLSDESKQKKNERSDALFNFKQGLTRFLAGIDILTRGFDDKDVNIGIKMYKTKSLPKDRQVDGRPARVFSPSIYGMESREERLNAIAKSSKPFGIIMDLGGNYSQHGRFDDVVDWNSYFYGKKEFKRDGNAPAKECPKCNSFIHASLPKCNEVVPVRSGGGIFMEECGHVFPKKEIRDIEIDLVDDSQPDFLKFTEPPKPLKDREFKEIYDVLSRKRGYEMEKIFLQRHCWLEDFKMRMDKLHKDERLVYLNRLVLAKVLPADKGIAIVREMLQKKAKSKVLKRGFKGSAYIRAVTSENYKIAGIIKNDIGKTDFEKYCNTFRKY